MACDMKALSSSYKGKKFLQITRSEDINLEDIKNSRHHIVSLFEHLEIERVIVDYKDVNLSSTRAVDIYMLIKAFKDDFPLCRQIALVSPSAPDNLTQHFKNASEYYDIELKAHSELETAKAWLCGD